MITIGRRLNEHSVGDANIYYRRAERLIQEMDQLNPWPRPRGFVVKAKTWEDYRQWRDAQHNPRLW